MTTKNYKEAIAKLQEIINVARFIRFGLRGIYPSSFCEIPESISERLEISNNYINHGNFCYDRQLKNL